MILGAEATNDPMVVVATEAGAAAEVAAGSAGVALVGAAVVVSAADPHKQGGDFRYGPLFCLLSWWHIFESTQKITHTVFSCSRVELCFPTAESCPEQLKPRSSSGVAENASAGASARSSNPFGAAKPREEILAKRGVDVRLVDERVEKKATVAHLSREQDEEVEAVRQELTRAEENLRDANEKELPEETFRVLCEEKRKELNELVAKFAEVNLKKEKERGGRGGSDVAPGQHQRHPRPSERHARRNDEDQDRRHHSGAVDADADDPYASFGGGGKRHDHEGGFSHGNRDKEGFGQRGNQGGRDYNKGERDDRYYG